MFKEIGDKIRKFNQSDPDVLTYSHATHLRKLKSGKYAYIADLTASQLEIGQSCDMDIIKEDFIPLNYALALQKNSAYKIPFTEGYVHYMLLEISSWLP